MHSAVLIGSHGAALATNTGAVVWYITHSWASEVKQGSSKQVQNVDIITVREDAGTIHLLIVRDNAIYHVGQYDNKWKRATLPTIPIASMHSPVSAPIIALATATTVEVFAIDYDGIAKTAIAALESGTDELSCDVASFATLVSSIKQPDGPTSLPGAFAQAMYVVH